MTTKAHHSKKKHGTKKATGTQRLANVFIFTVALGIGAALLYVLYERLF